MSNLPTIDATPATTLADGHEAPERFLLGDVVRDDDNDQDGIVVHITADAEWVTIQTHEGRTWSNQANDMRLIHRPPVRPNATAGRRLEVEWVKASDRPELVCPGRLVHNADNGETGVILFAGDETAIYVNPDDREFFANLTDLLIPLVGGAA